MVSASLLPIRPSTSTDAFAACLTHLYLCRKSNYIWDPKMRSAGLAMPSVELLKRWRELMAFVQAVTIKASIVAGQRTAEWWTAKLRPWLLRDDWKLAIHKQIPYANTAEIQDNWAPQFVRWAASLSLETAEAHARSKFGQRLHPTVVEELRARRVKFPQPFPRLPYASSASTVRTTTEERREQRVAALQAFPAFARAVLSREPAQAEAAVHSQYSKFQAAKFIAAILHQADDMAVCGYYSLYTTFDKETLTSMLARAARLPVRFVWQISATQILTDAERRRLGASVEQLSAAARDSLLDISDRSIYALKTPAARFAERSFFRLRIKGALNREAEELSGGAPVPEVEIDLSSGRAKELYHFYRSAWEEADGCPICRCEMTAILEHDSSLVANYASVKSTNVSMDRKIPGTHGGLYEPDNIEIMCAGCNFIKQHHTRESAIDIAAKLKARKGHLNVVDGRLRPLLPDTAFEPRPAQRETLLKWCQRAVTRVSATAERRRLEVTLTAESLLSRLLPVLTNAHTFVDATGVEVALEHASIDRIDPELGYHFANVRILITGLNAIRRKDRGDQSIIDYISAMRS